jgi:two-component system sensor histidine kinase MprB
MTLRGRVALVVALVVAGAVLLVGLGVQALAVRALVGAVDRDLRAVAADVERGSRGARELLAPRRDRFGGAAGVVQLVGEGGRSVLLPGGEDGVRLPVTPAVRAVAAGEAPAFLRTVEVEGRALRILTVPLADGLAAQVARPLDEAAAVIAELRRRIAVVSLLAAAVAALLARWAAGRSVRPVTDLTARVESVRGAGDLDTRLEVRGDDEVGRLAAAFNGMLARLAAARDAQERLTADASHELRTPLTSLRTNLEVLTLAEDGRAGLGADDRARLLADVQGQVDELTAMVDGLVAIARDGGADGPRGTVDLGALVEDVVTTARRRHPQRADDLAVVVDAAAGAVAVDGERARLASAVTNLVENAVKYAPSGPIEVTVSSATAPGAAGGVRIAVRDHGPGVAAEDLPHLFERFFRAASARSAPGAGLGLALVERVAHDHGGRTEANLPADGGLEVAMVLPRG